jgi:hypothetical protein
MSKPLTGVFILLIGMAAMRMLSPNPASAQVANGNVILLNVGAPSACAWPTSAATITNGMALCGTTSGLYYAINGGTFVPVAGAGGVASFNGRTGAVTLTKADVSATGLAATTTATTTASTTLQ